MSSMNRFQSKGLLGLVASSCFSVCAIKMTAKATAIFSPHCYSVGLQMFAIELKRVFFKDKSHEFPKGRSRDGWV